ncbi:uncharacterized protein [Euphorbia lathyris]|uniref:uncharacterized protein n=1 Tax=Euphorbia lathyris TaxID=212925 RepID=UPI0033144A25
MELELGLKITRTRDDIISHSNLQINKTHAGPLFLSRETDTIFFLIAYLKGFKRENIDIHINEDGNRITISGKRAVQEMVLSGSWIMHTKDIELRTFSKVFQIPDGIILDKIKAKFNDEQSSLTVIMPKSVKGMLGLQIQEIEQESKTDEIEQAVEKEFERICENDEETSQAKDEMPQELQNDDEDKQVDEEELIAVERQRKSRGSKLCPPFVVAGSAILVSLVVLVITFIRAKRR